MFKEKGLEAVKDDFSKREVKIMKIESDTEEIIGEKSFIDTPRGPRMEFTTEEVIKISSEMRELKQEYLTLKAHYADFIAFRNILFASSDKEVKERLGQGDFNSTDLYNGEIIHFMEGINKDGGKKIINNIKQAYLELSKDIIDINKE